MAKLISSRLITGLLFATVTIVTVLGADTQTEKNASTTRISGRWYVDFAKSSGIPPTRVSITDGEYVIKQGDAGLSAKFDGREYPIKGDEHAKNARLERVNSTTIREFDLGATGKIVETDNMTLGSDGLMHFIAEKPGEKPQTSYFRRVSGSDTKSINGEWEEEMWLQYDPIENGFHISSSDGGNWAAKFDGKRWPAKDSSWDSAQLTRIDDSSFYDIKYKGDEVAYIFHHSISPDGNELVLEALNPKSGKLVRFVHSHRTVEAQSRITMPVAESNFQRFAGTWTEDTSKTVLPVDTQSSLSYKQNSDGSLTETSISGTYKTERILRVDGKPHPLETIISVDGQIDTERSKPDPSRTRTWTQEGSSAWERQFKNGKPASTTLYEIGPDNQTMTTTETDYSAKGTSSQSSITTYRRATNAAGLLGTWKPISSRDVTPDAQEISFDGDATMHWHEFAPDYRYSAKFDGKDYPVTGTGNPHLRSALIKIDDQTWQEVVKDGDKPGQVIIRRLSSDGNTMYLLNIGLTTSATPLVTSYTYRRSVTQHKAE